MKTLEAKFYPCSYGVNHLVLKDFEDFSLAAWKLYRGKTNSLLTDGSICKNVPTGVKTASTREELRLKIKIDL